MLSLRDPADETNDLGRKGIAIKHVQATMRDLCEKLEASLKTNTRHSLLLPIVGHIYSLNLRRRQKLDTYGKQIADHLYSALSIKAKAIRDAETAGAEEAVQTDALSAQSEDEVNMEDEAMRLRQAKEQRDKQWRVLEDQRKEQLRLEAEQSSVPHAEHGEALASIQDGAQPAVEDGVQLAAEGEMQPVVEGEVQSAVEDGAQSAVEGDVQSAVKHEAQEKSGSVEEPKKE
jgi:non-canonical poly(A) RNA polymerase PAPD5/7